MSTNKQVFQELKNAPPGEITSVVITDVVTIPIEVAKSIKDMGIVLITTTTDQIANVTTSVFDFVNKNSKAVFDLSLLTTSPIFPFVNIQNVSKSMGMLFDRIEEVPVALIHWNKELVNTLGTILATRHYSYKLLNKKNPQDLETIKDPNIPGGRLFNTSQKIQNAIQKFKSTNPDDSKTTITRGDTQGNTDGQYITSTKSSIQPKYTSTNSMPLTTPNGVLEGNEHIRIDEFVQNIKDEFGNNGLKYLAKLMREKYKISIN